MAQNCSLTDFFDKILGLLFPRDKGWEGAVASARNGARFRPLSRFQREYQGVVAAAGSPNGTFSCKFWHLYA